MASIEKTIEIIFTARNEAQAVFSSIDSGLKSFETSITNVTGPLNSLSNTVLGVTGAIGALGVAVLGFAVNNAVKAEAALLDLQKVLSDSEGDAGQYAGVIRDLSNTFGVAGTNVTQSTASFKQAGFTIDEALSLTEAALTAVKITELDTNEVTLLLTRTLAGFRAPASEVANILDKVNEVGQRTNASTEELILGLARISPVADQLGLSFDEAIGLLTPVISVFGSGAESARGLRTALLNLTSDTDAVTGALESVGVAQRDQNSELRSGRDILFDLQVALKGASNETITFVSQEIAGVQQAGKFATVLRDQQAVLDVVAISTNSVGSSQKELQIRLQATEEVINRTKVAFTNASVALGDQFLPATAGVIDSLGNIGRALDEAIRGGAFDSLIELLTPSLVDLEVFFNQVASILPEALSKVDFQDFGKSIDDLKKTVVSLFDNFDFTSIEGLSDALQFGTDIATKFIEATRGIIDAFKPLVPIVISALEKLAALETETLVDAGEILGLAKIINTLAPGLSTLGDIISSVGSVLSLGFSGATLLAVTGGFTGLGAAITALGVALSPILIPLGAAAAIVGAFVFKDEIFAGLEKLKNLLLDSAGGFFGLQDAQAAAATGSTNLALKIEELKKKTGDASITADNFADKLAEVSREENIFAKESNAAAESVENLGGQLTQIQKDALNFASDIEFGALFAKQAGEAKESLDILEGALFNLKRATGDVIEGDPDSIIRRFEQLRENLKGQPDEFQKSALLEFLRTAKEEAPLAFDKLTDLLKGAGDESKNLAKNFELTAKSLESLGVDGVAELDKYVKKAKDAGLSTDEIKRRIEAMGLSFEGSSKKIELTNEQLAELQSKERVAVFEAQVNLNIAKLETDAQRFGDALQSAVDIAGQSADLIDKSLDILSDDRSAGDLEAGRVLKQESKIRQQETEAQLELIKSEIQKNEAVARRLEAGDFSINIEADGLEPELEAFMFRIIDRVHATASANAAEFLLGLNT